MTEYSGTSTKKDRGRSAQSLALIKAMYEIAAATQPITGRGIGYKLFTQKLIPDMSRKSMRVVYRLLKEAREDGTIPWEWIVDETRSAERVATWADPEAYSRTVANSYRRDFWDQQPVRVEIWSEKGTVRGVLQPVLSEYQVTFRALHGFNSATQVWDIAQDDDGREVIALYVGDIDPSGMCMSAVDLPKRLEKYDGNHVEVRRIALTMEQVPGLPSFPASDKGPNGKNKGDTRYKWFVRNYGDTCWELDAMDPRALRECVEAAIKELIEQEAWAKCDRQNKAEKNCLRFVMERWRNPMWDDPVV